MGLEIPLPIDEIEASINGEIVSIEYDDSTITIEYEKRTYIRAESKAGDYGCEIPIDADYEISNIYKDAPETYKIKFYDEDDVSELDSWDDTDTDYDSGAKVGNFEIID